MQEHRIVDLGRITSERVILQSHLESKEKFNTEVTMVTVGRRFSNEISEDILGLFHPFSARKAVIADMDMIREFQQSTLSLPTFLAAAPRSELCYDPHKVRAAIVTVGGVAPGLHSVIHSIVTRHLLTYSLSGGPRKVLGVYDSFRGMCDLENCNGELSFDSTEEWLDQGGSKLGNIRYNPDESRDPKSISRVITENLEHNDIEILYVIGGDGSLKTAHQIASDNPTRSIVGIPKTMDNDILWVWQSFGFNTTVEQATRVINTLHSEAEGTRRICLIELLGAESGFVAANASLASGHVDLVLIPEVFKLLDTADDALNYLNLVIKHLLKIIKVPPKQRPHAVAVIAEGVGAVLEDKEVVFDGKKVTKKNLMGILEDFIKKHAIDANERAVPVVFVQPRYLIRAVPANPYDQIYCARLGALAVDNALAGYTDFMISQWLNEFVLVPLHLVVQGKKSIPVKGMFWKQVVSSTQQPLSPAERKITPS